ncbi:hypothetical protein GI374_15950 [Paracoccus sp. S-4012]|uniref:hypothetical protein n=1 Tax=Paracoccus sp. S-4012 TaxID=2665648 RepID=UPI0012B070C3|nr:hypothetical protein [Paracoccus sp. S-4012]MRX51885.1 hypothetical protein [Paracoccus sp. S-4012]
MLKHAIHALSHDRLGDAPTEAELDEWVTRMEQIKGDSLGTLIGSLLAACDSCGVEHDMRAELEAIRDRRNMLCHASWKPVAEAEGGGWRPAFVSSRNMEVPERMVTADLRAIRARTLAATRRIGAVARATGHDGVDAAQIEAERARARARAARRAAERRLPDQEPAAPDPRPALEPASHWHPLDADDEAARRRGRRHPDPRRPRRDPEDRA